MPDSELHIAPLEDIAIVGMDCIFPGAPDLHAFWNNILAKKNAVDDAPPDWDGDRYYDPDSTANDRIYTKKGGFLRDLAVFDPLKHGVVPNSIDGGEPDQFLALEVAQRALVDADYAKRPVPSERIEVILGRGTYINRGFTTVVQHGIVVDRVLDVLRTLHPEHGEDELAEIKRELKQSLPPFNPEMAPALVPNLVTGRIANRLDFQGVNYIIDAACASSLIAVQKGIEDLRAGRCDVAVSGGIQASTPAPIFMIFCQLAALSRRGQIRPFDQDADGTILAEGVGILVLKRLSDAEAAGDRIYALIKSIGTASDGRAVGMLAPRVEGEILALRNAYAESGVDPRTVGLVEAHGTATAAGDAAEVASLKAIFGVRAGTMPTCALGSVKSSIGHCLPAAGSAGLIKAALALHTKILPPTINCENPNPKLGLGDSSFYINTESRPWIHGAATPRRAGVNAFGFGGINAHAVLEEYRPRSRAVAPFRMTRASEVFILAGETHADIADKARHLAASLSGAGDRPLAELAAAVNPDLPAGLPRLAVVAATHAEAAAKLTDAATRLGDVSRRSIRDRRGLYFKADPKGESAGVAFLFPGEGSQYPNMLGDLAMHFPEVRAWFDRIDKAFAGHRRGLLPSQVIFPPPAPAGGKPGLETLFRMDVGPEAIFAANQAAFAFLGRIGLRPDAIVGHSTGEYSALIAAGAQRFDENTIGEDIRALNDYYETLSAAGGIAKGHLIALAGVKADTLRSLLAERDDLFLAMDNCPNQQVVCALSDETAAWLEEKLTGLNALSARLPFDRAYHTPAFQSFCDGLHPFFDRFILQAPHTTLYSCMSAARMAADPADIRRLAINQWASRVRFRETVERMYDDGITVFVECGPRNNLCAFVDDVLKGRPHLAVPLDVEHLDGITQANHMIAQLAVEGVGFSLADYYPGISAAPSAAKIGNRPGPITLKTGLQAFRLQPRAALAQVPGAFGAASPAPFRAAPVSPAPVVQPVAKAIEPEPVPTNLVAAMGDADVAPVMVGADDAELFSDRRLDGQDDVLGAYFETMESFLRSQQDVMSAFLAAGHAQPHAEVTVLERPAPTPLDAAGRLAAAPRLFPLLSGAAVEQTGDAFVARVTIDVRDHIYLEDHTIGRDISTTDPDLQPLSVVPLTFSMELMAEAAALATGEAVIGMREVRGQRWIGLDHAAIDLEILVRRTAHCAPDEMHVMVRPAPEQGRGASRLQPAFIEGFMRLADAPPPAPVAAPWTYRQPRPSRWKPDEIYSQIMFHGPRLRAIDSMDRWAEDGSEGTLVGMAHDRLFAWTTAPRFLTDAISLDAAGQLIGMWTSDHLDRAFHVFPFRMERLDIFGANLAPGERATCRARIELVGESEVRSDIDIVGGDGLLRCRIIGWWDKRFDLPDRFFRLRRAPWHNALARPLDAVSAPGLAAMIVDDLSIDFLESSGHIWLRVLAKLALSAPERAEWFAMKAVTKRRIEWLLGRVAAKDAVRALLRERGLGDVCLTDVEVRSAESGQPVISASWPGEWGPPPHLSIAHTDGRAVALAGSPDRYAGVGVDIETVELRPDSFLAAAFTAREQTLIAAVRPADRAEAVTRLWCAKEAAGKAIGSGLADVLDGLEVQSRADDPQVRVAVKVDFGQRNRVPKDNRDGETAFGPENRLGTENAIGIVKPNRIHEANPQNVLAGGAVIEVATVRESGYLIATVTIPAAA